MRAPERLSKLAKKKWKAITAEVQPVNPLQVELLTVFCEQWEIYLMAKEQVSQHGMITTAGKNGAPYQYPAVGVMNKAVEQMNKIYKLLTDSTMKAAEQEDEFEHL